MEVRGALAQGRGCTNNSFFRQVTTLVEAEDSLELKDIFLRYLLHFFLTGGGRLIEIPSRGHPSDEVDSSDDQEDGGFTLALAEMLAAIPAISLRLPMGTEIATVSGNTIGGREIEGRQLSCIIRMRAPSTCFNFSSSNVTLKESNLPTGLGDL